MSSRVIPLPSLAVEIRLPFFVTPLNLIVGDNLVIKASGRYMNETASQETWRPVLLAGKSTKTEYIQFGIGIEAKEGLMILSEPFAFLS